jgi:hypothetical protein
MVNILRNTSQVCGTMGNKADATHQAVSQYIQLARTRESRCYASSCEPIHSVGPYKRKPMLSIRLRADMFSRPIYKKHILCIQRTELVK